MSHLIEVAFKGNRKEFFLWEADELPPLKAALIVEADRGEDLGRVHAIGELAAKRSAGVPHGLAAEGAAPARKAIRLATADDVKRGADLAEQNESARRRAMERVKANGLVMKLTDAEWQWDRKKLTFYFTAEKRVDFRNLVRDLASMFRTRIELKQIGVRDEARRLDGIGRCGRQYCSSSWLPELRPVNLGVAKDQRLSLNPTQISGACGRLMCCLRYEHEFYVQSRKRFPKEGKILVTSLGEEKVVANDIFNDRVTLRRPDGDARVVPLADLKREIAVAAGAVGEEAAAATLGVDAGADDDPAGTAVVEGAEYADDEARDDVASGAASASAGPTGSAERRHDPARRGGRPAEQPSAAKQQQRRPRPERGEEDDAALTLPAAPAAAPTPSWLRQRSPLPQAATAPATSAPPAPTSDSATAAAATVAAVDAPEATPSATEPVAGSGAAATEDGERRARRRRGRRGGRRGRGGAGDRAGSDGGAGVSDGTDGAKADDVNERGDDATADHRSTDDDGE
ncbi:MAG TPA: regulatory iron-sulfur-containing complex subunit RicT [Gemmatimonadaceae bacterium]|nr:regulatory iron-sulfur-containing complex subunit RicT [Gemmatimonadaceae bacterium]